VEKRARASTGQPLAGIRVVDLTSMVSGPLATCILADQGADVIKVEPPGTGDLLRHMGFRRGGMSAIFATVNRGKRSLALDLGKPRGQELARRLVRGADVFVQNFRPGVADELGLSEPALRAERPDLVYASISGFGRRGPYARYPAYDIVIQALSGMAALQADEEGGAPALVQTGCATRWRRCTPRRRSARRCSPGSAERAASTWSSRCSAPPSRSCGPTGWRPRPCWGRESRRPPPACGTSRTSIRRAMAS
jgi:hypothetical protein